MHLPYRNHTLEDQHGIPRPAAFRKNRSVLLDCIRACAILAVIVYHVATRYDQAALDPVAQIFRRYGLLGVDVFFPLSGYLITRFLLKADRPHLIGVFFQRRFFRIVPLYVAAVTIFFAAVSLLGLEGENTDRIWVTYLFLTGWFIFFEGREAVPYTITWSLSVEEFAYILFGLCAWLGRRNLPVFLLGLSTFALGLRLWLNVGLEEFPGVYNFPPARLDSIAIGGLVAILLERRVRGLAVGLGLATAATFLLALWVPALWSSLKYTFIAFGTAALIVLFETQLRGLGEQRLKWLADIGFYSYFTYLFHIFNIHILLEFWERFFPEAVAPFWGVVLAALMLTQIQAVLSFRFFEGPIMTLGRRLERLPIEDNPSSGTPTRSV